MRSERSSHPEPDAPRPRRAAKGATPVNPSRHFIERPVATSLLMLAILLVGGAGFSYLPLSALPEVDYPTIQVQTFLPGASPEVMTSAVTAPLERQFGEMPGLNQMSSVSAAGDSVITLQFGLTLSLDVAEQEVQAAINAAANLLPQSLPAPPVYAKVNPADAPILTLAITSSQLPMTELDNLAETRIAQKISQLAGVGLVSINGGQRPAVRVEANLQVLAAQGLNIDDLRTTIANANINTPKGNFDGPTSDYTINTNDQLQKAGDYKGIVVAYRNGAPVYLTDVASVIDGAENDKVGSWVNKTPAILLNIQRQPGANVIAVVDSIKALLPDIQDSLPGNVSVAVVTDRTNTIRASVSDVEMELGLAVVLVVLVIFLFLRSIPATFVPSLSVPLSIVGTFAVMYLFGFSLNNLSLMALTIAAGFVVDDAIVMIENISRHLEMGAKPMEAALKGAGEIAFTIVSLTISLIAVLIPLLFMQEVVGRLFREFAITLAFTILISAVVSLTLVPMLCARLLKPVEKQHHGSFNRKVDKLYDKMVKGYDRMLKWVLARQPLMLVIAVCTLALTAVLYIAIPKGFFPLQDSGFIFGFTQAAPSVSFATMAERQQAVAEAVLKDPAVASLTSFIGIDGSNTTLNSGRFLINLKAKGDRSGDIASIVNRLTRETADIAGITLHLQPVQDLTTDSTVSLAQYQFFLQAARGDILDQWVPKLLERLGQTKEIGGISTTYLEKGLSASITVDRDTATRLGITLATVDNALYDAFGQRIISTIYTQSNTYRVILEADRRNESTVADLDNIYLPTSGGGQAPLSTLAHVDIKPSAQEVDHLGQFPAAFISFNVAPGSSLGAAVNAITKAEKDIGMPPSVTTKFQGAALAFQSALGQELLLILAAIVAVYIVLGVLYESYIHPVTILSTLPSAGIGALLALMLTGEDLGIIAIIGIVLLIGIVKKNAIMMIDFALSAERNDHKSPQEAIHQAALLRFRPIMMTTVAALFAALPLVLAGGMGAELRRPLGITIIGGLLVSQLLTLFTTPVIYLFFGRMAERVRGLRRRRSAVGRPRYHPS